jgi:REP element-mobilizing transposase RayT
LFITRRCTQREFLLRPDDETNNAFTYLLGEASQRFGVDIVLEQMMSNHHHTVLYDSLGRQVEFREHFHKLLAKSQNALRGRWENLFSSVAPSVVEVVTREALLDKLVYTATNPVKDGLVDKVHHWPGPKFLKALLTGKPMKARRPKHFFREDGPMPPEVELVLKLPDHFEGKAEFLAELRRRIAEVEEACAGQRRATGRRVVGRSCILRQSPRSSPTSREPRRNLNPRVASRSAWERIAALQRNKEWEAEYRAARKRWIAGEPAVFPFGTYWLRRHAAVPVRPPEPS